ncbi:MAG: hypothetical protein MJZ61_08560 [Bacteroidales bacterium]|nr:hypothetical protein [Bacteroidales bacterium]
MKNLTTSHISNKQSILSELVNSGQSDTYTNVKISLLNNALVFPVPPHFAVEDFSAVLLSFFKNELKIKTEVDKIGDDIFSLQFSPILGLMKKAVVFCLLDQHLYINIVPVKEMENANYSEGKISELLSSGKTDQILDFVEKFILGYYPEEMTSISKPNGRYFYSDSLGVPVILASHLEGNEQILAKLDIYKVEKSKSNAQTSEVDLAFYITTTEGSYLFVLDTNLQEKYVETLSDQELTVQSKLGRDPVFCGNTQWLSNRDNDFLFQEVSKLNNKSRHEKLEGFSQLLFNLGETPEDKTRSAYLLKILAKEDPTPFSDFSANLIEFSNSISEKDGLVSVDNDLAISLMETANSLLSEDGFETKVQKFLENYNFSSLELATLIFAISRVKNRIQDTAVFASVMKMLKERFCKIDQNIINRGFLCVSIAKKLNIIGEKESAYELAKEAYDSVGYNPASLLAPGMDLNPDNPNSGDVISYMALDEMCKAAQNDKDKICFAQEMAELKPLISANLENILKYSPNDMLAAKVNKVLTVFNAENFGSITSASDLDLSGKFSKIDYMPKYTEWRKTYSGFKSWVEKAHVDKSLTSMKYHGEIVDSNNYHILYDLCEQMAKYFDIQGVEVFVFKNRSQGIMSNDDGDSKYIFIDEELLDISNPNYMNGNELAFALAREFASLKLGYSRLASHPQWRNFAVSGVSGLDVISNFAADSSFIKDELENYTKIENFSRLLIKYADYYQFDVESPENAAKMLSDTLQSIKFAGSDKLPDLKERELSALSLLTASILDRIGLIVCSNIVSAIRAMIHSDPQARCGGNFDPDSTVYNLACSHDVDGKPLNYDFAMRLSSLLAFYVSDDYKKN